MKCGVWNQMKIWSSHLPPLAGQFKQLPHEPEKFRWLNGIRTHDLCDAGIQTHDLCDAGIAEVMGLNPVESPEFFRFMRQFLKFSSKCEDHIFI